jgi:amino acid adenylation domain-containing protein
MLLHEFLDAAARRSPDAVAVTAGGRAHTYDEIRRRAAALARRLQDHGVVRGDRVLVYLDNGVEAVVAFFGVLMCGAVAVPVNPATKADKLAYLLGDSGARVLIAHAPLADNFRSPLQRAQAVVVCLVVGSQDRARLEDARCAPFEPDGAADAEPSRPATIDQDLAAIIYTSGSTGEPKGVMLSHLNMVSAARSVNGYLGYAATDVVLCGLPLSFDYGLYQVLMTFMVGARVVIETSLAFPARIVEVLRSEAVTVLPAVPTVFSMLLGHRSLRGNVPESLRMITNTAAALPTAHIEALRALFPKATLYSMYGLTECKRVTYLPPEQLDVRPESVGRGMPNEEVWLEDEFGNRLAHGGTGELVVRGSNVMRGYWRKPDATAERLKPGPLPGEFVLRSGDVFRTDAEGYLYFVARKDDIIKTRGEKVSPREVEGVLYGMEGVAEAAVIGVHDELLGHAIKAYVVLRPGATYSERDVIRYCLSKLESFMAPKQVVFVDELPKTVTGKISKTTLA